MLTNANSGMYTCTATNSFGSASASTEITIVRNSGGNACKYYSNGSGYTVIHVSYVVVQIYIDLAVHLHVCKVTFV